MHPIAHYLVLVEQRRLHSKLKFIDGPEGSRGTGRDPQKNGLIEHAVSIPHPMQLELI